MASSPSHEEHPVPHLPEGRWLLFLYSHLPKAYGYSLYALDLNLDSLRPSGDDDDAVKRFPEPILSFGEDGDLPFAMASFVSGSRLYMVGGGHQVSGSSKATYFIDLKDIQASLDATDPMSLVRRGPDMEIKRCPPLVIPVAGMVYVFSVDLFTSSRVEKFDPGAVSWALLPGDLGLHKVRRLDDVCMYVIMSYVVHASSIYLSTRAGVFVFHTDTGTWTTPENATGGMKMDFLFGCMESSQFYVSSSRIPGRVLLDPTVEPLEFADPILGDFDLLVPYEEHVGYNKNYFLVQASRDRFCFVCEGFDLPISYSKRSRAKKHIVVHAFELLQDVAPATVDSLCSPPDRRHQSLTRVLYTMDVDNPLRFGEIDNVFLISTCQFKTLKLHSRRGRELS